MGVSSCKRQTAPRFEPDDALTYLGATMFSDGGIKSELNRKLGMAWGEFAKLDKIWKHTCLSKTRKVEIYRAMIVTRLLYGLSSAWLNAADLRRLDGFHCRCLRRIVRIPPAYVSRVSNASVLDQASQPKLSKLLLKQQLVLFGRVARAPESDPLRKITFCNDLRPVTDQFVRRVGRPRNEWAVMLHREALKMNADMSSIIHNVFEWKRAVHRYCQS